MKKQYRNWLYIALGIIALAIIIRLYRSYKDKQEEDEPAEPIPGGSGGNPRPLPEPGPDVDKMLRRGVKGKEVKLLQERLNKDRGTHQPIAVDGDFGPKTEALLTKVKNVQQITLRQYAASQASTGVDPSTWGWVFGN